jgi:glycosyltransferase involved in cell wall biosynthesis
MRVGIDARELAGHPTGVGRYLGALVREWAGDPAAQRHDFVLYTPEPLDVRFDARRFASRVIQGFPGTLWEQFQLPRVARTDHLDVFFAPAYTAPLSLTVPTVVTIHDLSYEAHPEWFRLREGARRRLLTRQSARRAAAVIAVSEFSKREVIDRLGLPEHRVSVIRSGIDAPAVPANAGPAAPRLLYVGSIFNRRHVPELVRAFARVARDHPEASLDIVGSNRTHPHENIVSLVESAGLNGRVRLQQYAQESVLRELYAGARAFVFLSEYEGFGFTPLEALAVGLPPVVGDTPVAREIYGDAALFVRWDDVRAIAKAIELALYDEPTRRRILEAAPAALQPFSWPRAARETLDVIERAGKT